MYLRLDTTAGVLNANAADLVLCPGDNIVFDIASTNSGTLDANSSHRFSSYLSVATASITTANVWTPIAGASQLYIRYINTPPILLKTRRYVGLLLLHVVQFLVQQEVAGLPSNVVSSINVRGGPRNPTITTNGDGNNSLCSRGNEFSIYVNTTDTQPIDTYQWDDKWGTVHTCS